ncbi:MAG: tetratricopeptide repeat protein [Candidatus Marinimicrobia bacterium]|nr:tetratricopeptide repeat protein [Candidatus Neomarinimicrobiota bacterium]
MKTRKLMVGLLILISFSLLILNQCVPPPPQEGGEEAQVTEEETQEEDTSYDSDVCDRYLSFAWNYYNNRNWKRAIVNFKRMIENNCAEAYAEDIYIDYGRAYMNLAKNNETYYDSAAGVFLEGLEYLPENEYLRENLAYVHGRLGESDQQIRQYEKLHEMYPDNLDYLRTLVKLNFQQENYREVLRYTDKILEINPDDKQAINDKMTALENMGKDVITVQKDAWENNRSVRTGLNYANALKEREKYQQAIAVYKEVTNIDRNNYEAWNNMADCYTSINRPQEAIKSWSHIANQISPQDIKNIQKIVDKYISLGEYANATEWAKKAISRKECGLSYKLAGDVYYDAAENCRGGQQPGFEDKLVYKIAYDYYEKAVEFGFTAVKSRIDRLENYLIPTTQDWFMNRYNQDGSRRNDYTPRKECYDWIKESAQKD